MWERQKSIAASRGGKEGDKILRLVDIIDRGRVFCQFEFYKRIRLHTNSTQLNKSELLNLRKTTMLTTWTADNIDKWTESHNNTTQEQAVEARLNRPEMNHRVWRDAQ